MLRFTTCCLAAVLALAINAAADDPADVAKGDEQKARLERAFGKPFDEAVAKVLQRCEQAEAKQVLLLVRADEAVKAVPEGVLEVLAAELEQPLEGAKLAVETPADWTIVPERPKRMLSPRELRSLDEAFEFDVVLEATFRENREGPMVRLALFDARRRLTMAYAPLGERPALVASIDRIIAARRAAAARAAVNGRVMRGGRVVAGGGVAGSAGAAASAGGAAVAGGTARAGGGAGGGGGAVAGGGGGAEGGAGGAGDGDAPKPPAPGNPTGLNAAVLRFAQQNFGQQVGDGECWTLAARALVAAGARPAVGYVFGTSVNRRDATPGDILQFKNVRLERGNRFWTLGTPNHTAVIEAIDGSVVTVLHQNFGTRTVTRLTFDFDDMVRGEVRCYRPRR